MQHARFETANCCILEVQKAALCAKSNAEIVLPFLCVLPFEGTAALAPALLLRRPAHRDAARRTGSRIGSPADTNGGMSSEALIVKALTRRLVAREAGECDASVSVAHIVHGACEHACRALFRSIGPRGFHALLLRALAQVENEHPLVEEIRVGRQLGPLLSGVSGMEQRHGASAVAAGLEATLETLLSLVGRLIGVDVVAQLVEQRVAPGTTDTEDVH